VGNMYERRHPVLDKFGTCVLLGSRIPKELTARLFAYVGCMLLWLARYCSVLCTINSIY
jgi:hypothetical protein